jgi:hypothetical protein
MTYTRPAIVQYLADHGHKNKLITLSELTKATGFTIEQVQSQMRNLAARDDFPLKTVSRGQGWVYSPEPEETAPTENRVGELWEVVGRIASTGEYMIRDEAGFLYRATEMK